MFPPQRIVCLTEETVETLYLLGEQDRIVGVSGHCVRPPDARPTKPRVSTFTSADIPKIPGQPTAKQIIFNVPAKQGKVLAQRAQVTDGMRARKSGSHVTPRWRGMDSNLYGAFAVK